MRFLSLLLTLLCTSAYAEVLAVIQAPSQVNIGDLVVLDISQRKGDNHVWVVDQRVTGRYLEFDNQLVFAIGTPGTYEFQLIVADKSANIAHTKHLVTVGPPGLVPPPPGPGPGPITPPSPPVSSPLSDTIKAATQAVNDPPTALALRQALLSLPEKSPEAIKKAISDVLLKRTGESQKKDWLNTWRVPVDKAIDESKLPFNDVYNALLKGLEVSAVTVFTRPNCSPCEEWKLNEAPKLLRGNWYVEFVEDLSRETPSFTINHQGQVQEVTGYMPVSVFNSIVTSMKDK